MSLLVLFNLVKEHMDWTDTKTRLWFNTKNSSIGESTPLNYYNRRPEKCERWILNLIDENSEG